MKIITTLQNEYLASLQDDAETLSGGTVNINGTDYKIKSEEVSEIPEGAKDLEYIFKDGALVRNEDYSDTSIERRLDDIEQILIDLLDTI